MIETPEASGLGQEAQAQEPVGLVQNLGALDTQSIVIVYPSMSY